MEKNYQQPSLQTLSEWLLNFSKACNDLNSINHVTQSNFKTPGKPTFLSGYNNATNDKKHSYQRQFPNNVSDYLQCENKQTAIKSCPSNENCQFLYKCTHFQSLPPCIRRDHIRKLKMCFNCFEGHHVDKCTSKNVYRNNNCGKKHHTLLHDSFDINPGSKKTNVKAVHIQGTGQAAVVPVQLKNGKKTLNTYVYLDNGSCQSLLLKSAASELNIDMKFVGKMPISGCHMTKEIDCSPVKVYIKPLQSDQQSFLLTDVIAVPNLNMSPVDTEKLNQLCASFETSVISVFMRLGITLSQ